MGLIKKLREELQLMRDPEIQKILDSPGGYVDASFEDSGGVRFSSRDAHGLLDSYVLLYAVPRSDGLFDVAAMARKGYDAGERRGGVACGLLDHEPVDGEYVVGWIPKEDMDSLEVYIDIRRARKYMSDNGIRGVCTTFVFTKDNKRYRPLDPEASGAWPDESKLVVCNADPAAVVPAPGGALLVRVPCDLGGDGFARVEAAPGEAVDDPWHPGRKALVMVNAPGRAFYPGAAGGERSTLVTSVFVAHVKAQEQIVREASPPTLA